MIPAAQVAARLIVVLCVRWSGLAMATGFALRGQWVEAAVSMLVALAQVVSWRSRLPCAWEVATSVTCLLAAISSFLLLYEKFSWWDVPVHAALTGLLAVLVTRLLAGPFPAPRRIVLTGAGLAIVWELMELAGHHWVDSTVNVAPADTVSDIAAGVTGSVLAALLWRRRHRPDRTAPGS